jgi:hypothetical protein
MNQSKFTLADLLTIIFAGVYSAFCFLSFNFISLGNKNSSLFWAAFIFVILTGLALGIKLLKKTDGSFKVYMIWEFLLLSIFLYVATVFVFPFSHYFVVSVKKESIQQNVSYSITEAEKMYSEYEKYADNRLYIYESRLKSVAIAKDINPGEYRQYGFVQGTRDSTQVENKIFVLRSKLYPSNYSEIKRANEEWLAKARQIITDWRAIGIVTVLKEMETNLDKWKNELIEFSSYKAQAEKTDAFDYELTIGEINESFTTFGSPTILSIVVAVLLYFFMLISYIIAARHTRSPGYKVFFRGPTSTNNTRKKW